jgi:hypothetical protein
VAWSLSYQSIRNPELADALLLAAGKALYLANAFEVKCKSVLKIFNIVEAIETDPVLSLEQAIAKLPKDKMIGGTLQDILRCRVGDDSATAELLDKARSARNFIAHEGVAVGAIWGLRTKAVIHHANLLRSAVDDLVAGDNVVSAWCYEIEEKEPAPQVFKAAYPAMANDWVFGQLDLLLESIDPADDHHRTLRERFGLT